MAARFSRSFDAEVIVVGSGPAGSAAAASLATQGHDVLLLDRATFPRDKTCGDGLTPRAIAALGQLGALEEVLAAGHRVTGARLYSPQGHIFHARFDEYLDDLPDYGLMVPRLILDDLLRRHAIASGAAFQPQATFVGLEDGDLLIEHERRRRRAKARVYILATGARMGPLQALGVMKRPPNVVRAVRGYWENVPGAEDAFEFYFDRQLPYGYGWLFPLGQGRANVGIGLFPAGRHGSIAPQTTLLSFLSQRSELVTRISSARRASPLRGYPIRTDFPSHPVVSGRLLIVGEAAGLVNPASGEGIDLAFESGLLAAEVVSAALRSSAPLETSLVAYEEALWDRFGGYFKLMRRLLPVVMRPGALEILIRKADRHADLARTIVLVTMGLASPREAFTWRTWRRILL